MQTTELHFASMIEVLLVLYKLGFHLAEALENYSNKKEKPSLSPFRIFFALCILQIPAQVLN